MNKVAVVIFTESEPHSDFVCVVNALEVAKVFKESCDQCNSGMAEL